jgi:hypothetical protein
MKEGEHLKQQKKGQSKGLQRMVGKVALKYYFILNGRTRE